MSEDKPRYSRVSDIIDLAIFMSSKLQGITISDIMERYNVSRRTAERMRDSLTCIFPQIEEIENYDDNQKHWGFVNYSISQLVSFTPEEIINIEQQQRRTTNKEAKEALRSAVEKMLLLSQKNKRHIENDVELYMQTEGYAIRQMPRYKINLEIISIVRDALKNSKMITAIYHDKKRLLEPLGLIYGEKIHLIAREKAKGEGIYNYHLHKFTDMKLTGDTFDKKDFDLQEYTNRSFGIYQGDIMDVKLSFDKDIAQDVLNYNFHPTQKFKIEEDGSVTLKFKASGAREIMWHVFKWGKQCKILAPKVLKKEYEEYLEENLKNYKKPRP